MKTVRARWSAVCGVVAIMASMAFITGCSHESNSPPPAPTPTEIAAHDPVVHNPPSGQPNHLTPEMQAQIDRYKTMGNGAPQTPAPAPGQ